MLVTFFGLILVADRYAHEFVVSLNTFMLSRIALPFWSILGNEPCTVTVVFHEGATMFRVPMTFSVTAPALSLMETTTSTEPLADVGGEYISMSEPTELRVTVFKTAFVLLFRTVITTPDEAILRPVYSVGVGIVIYSFDIPLYNDVQFVLFALQVSVPLNDGGLVTPHIAYTVTLAFPDHVPLG